MLKLFTLNMSLIWPLFAMILIDVLEVDNMVLVVSLVGTFRNGISANYGTYCRQSWTLPVLIMSKLLCNITLHLRILPTIEV